MEETNKKEEISNAQKRFCEEYMKDLDCAGAAVRAGYSEKSAGSMASRMLKKPVIAAYLKKLQNDLALEMKITTKSILIELARIAYCNVQDFLDENNQLRKIDSLDPDKAALISYLRIIEINTAEGKRTITHFKLHDRIKALEKLGRHLGLFDHDQTEMMEQVGRTIIIKPHREI